MTYPKSFLSNFDSLLTSCPFNCGRAQAAFIGGDYESIDDTLLNFSNNKDFPNFALKAKRLLDEYHKIYNYNKLKESSTITTEQYCDLFLRHIYDEAQLNGFDHNQGTDEVQEYFGITSYKQTRNIFDILNDLGLIDVIVELEDGSFVFQLNGKGTHYVETGGKTGVIKTYLSNSTVYNDQSVNIQKNYGQAFTCSSGVTQYLTIENPKDVLDKLENMKQLIESSQEDKEVKDDALLTIATLENEVKKKKPVMAIITSSLEVLSHIATVSAYAYGLAKFLGVPLP